MAVTINQATFPLNSQGSLVLPRANNLEEAHQHRDEVRLAGYASTALYEVDSILERMVKYDNSSVDLNPEAGKVVYSGAAEQTQPSEWIDLQTMPGSFDCELSFDPASSQVQSALIYTPSRMDRETFNPAIVGESKVTYSNADGKETIRIEQCSHGTNNYTMIRDHNQNTLTVISEFERS